MTAVMMDNKSVGVLYCPICTRYVEGQVIRGGKKAVVAPGQKCPRCASSLDAAMVVKFPQAA